MAVMTKFALTFTILTRVVLSARVSAAVKSAHIAALNARFKRKNVPLTRNSTIRFEGDKESNVAMCEDRVDVNAVVVLESGTGGQ
jgi:hypothetical protein